MTLKPPDPECELCGGSGMLPSDWPCTCAIEWRGGKNTGATVTDGKNGPARIVPQHLEEPTHA